MRKDFARLGCSVVCSLCDCAGGLRFRASAGSCLKLSFVLRHRLPPLDSLKPSCTRSSHPHSRLDAGGERRSGGSGCADLSGRQVQQLRHLVSRVAKNALGFSITLRVEAARADQALARSESVRGEDVTAEHAGFDARVGNLKAAKASLQ